MKQWYEEFFTNYANTYDKEAFTQGTLSEVDFLEKELDYKKTKKILDVGCGTGRHSIELAKRGYNVTGVDLSLSQLKRAKEKAKEAGVKAVFLKKDARKINYKNEYDFVMLICEAAFPLMETDEMNFKILQNAANALKKRGKLMLTTLNGLFPIFNSTEQFMQNNVGEIASKDHYFDLKTLRDYSTVEFADDMGKKKLIKCNERYYMPSEINWYLKFFGFKKIDIYGCDTGKFGRDIPLTKDNFEMLVIGEK